MKSAIRFVLLILALFTISSLAFAQDAAAPATPDVGSAPGLVTLLSPLIVSLVIWGVRKIAPKIPSWLIPLSAPILGVAVEYVNTLATQHQANYVLAAGLGLAATGLYEAKKQLGKVVSPPSS